MFSVEFVSLFTEICSGGSVWDAGGKNAGQGREVKVSMGIVQAERSAAEFCFEAVGEKGSRSIEKMSARLQAMLAEYEPSMMLYGSVTMNDFKFGWSDIDFCLVTERPIPQELCQSLVFLRQQMADENEQDPFFRLFEGVIAARETLFSGEEDMIVYWGTSGQRILSEFSLDPFTKMELIRDGVLVFGRDFRNLLSFPSRAEVLRAIQRHYEAIRKYGASDAGWLLDTARCLYTLKTNQIAAKTAAGEWALEHHLCPNPEVMKKALEIRRNPEKLLKDESVTKWLKTITPQIQEFADALEDALQKEMHSGSKI